MMIPKGTFTNTKQSPVRTVMERAKKAKAMNNPEHDLQCACVKWFSLQYPQYDRLLFAIPNGGHRDIRTAARLKAEGVKRGVADLFLSVPILGVIPGTDIHGLYIEMKAGKNKLTKDQKEFMNQVEGFNYWFSEVRNIEFFIKVITGYMKLAAERS